MIIGILLGILNQTDTVPANTQDNFQTNQEINLNSISLSEWKNLYDNNKDYIVIDVYSKSIN